MKRPPGLFFSKPHLLQEELTANLYKSVSREEPLEVCDQPAFEKWHTRLEENYKLPEAYKGFYDRRLIKPKDWDLQQINTKSTENL
jgi:hypothetical protein